MTIFTVSIDNQSDSYFVSLDKAVSFLLDSGFTRTSSDDILEAVRAADSRGHMVEFKNDQSQSKLAGFFGKPLPVVYAGIGYFTTLD